MPRKTDLEKVVQAKVLNALGKNNSEIGKQIGVSGVTAQRYVTMEIEGADELIRERFKQEMDKFSIKAWDLIHKGLDQLAIDLAQGMIKSKDLITMIGVLFDKNAALQQTGIKTNTHQEINFIFNSTEGKNKSKLRPQSNPNIIPSEPGEIPGNDLWPGSGEDILALPGGCTVIDAVSGDEGSDSSFDVSEPE